MPFVFPAAARRGTHCLKLLAVLSAALLIASCASEAQRREGLALISDGRYEEGLAKLDAARKADPNNAAARRDTLSQKEQITNKLLNAAAGERAAEHFDAAETLCRRALALDPNSTATKQFLADLDTMRRHAKLLADAQALAKKGDVAGAKSVLEVILVENPGHVKANQLRYQLAEQTLKDNLAGPTLNIQGRKPVTLQFRDANLKMVLEAISRTTGVNILLDKDVRNDIKVTIFIKDTPVEETLDLILLQNQLEKRVLGENTVLIYPFNPAKSKDYQELKVRRFALTNADPKQVQNMIKTIIKTKDIFVDEKTNALVIRDTPQAIRLAEKMVAAMDQPDPEVLLEVEVMDISRDRELDLGLDFPTDVTWSLPVSKLSDWKHRSSNNVNLSTTNKAGFGVTLQALKKDGDTTDLATPRLRVRNKEKAKILIGERLAVITSQANGSVPTGVTTTTPIFNQSIQYIEAGIKLEVEPTIRLDGEVSIKLNLEVSTPTQVTTGDPNLVAYNVTTNNVTTALSIRDGETQLMGGLIRATDSQNASKIPGLGDMPLLGRLFGIQQDKNNKHEIVLAITPHIVSNNQISEADLLELWSGTESNIKSVSPDLKAAGSAGVLSQGSTTTGAARTGPAAPARAQVPPAAATVPAPAASAASSATEAAAGLSLAAVLSGPQQAKVGDKINVAVSTQGAAAVNALTFELQYDTETLKAIAVNEGDLMRRTGVKSAFSGDIDESGGRVTGVLTADTGSASGNGSIASIQFEVIGAQRPAVVSVSSIAATSDGSTGVPIASPQPLSIAVQPQP